MHSLAEVNCVLLNTRHTTAPTNTLDASKETTLEVVIKARTTITFPPKTAT